LFSVTFEVKARKFLFFYNIQGYVVNQIFASFVFYNIQGNPFILWVIFFHWTLGKARIVTGDISMVCLLGESLDMPLTLFIINDIVGLGSFRNFPPLESAVGGRHPALGPTPVGARHKS
jgi:hypothetical protein